MTLQVAIPESLLRQVRELAERQSVSLAQIIAVALSAQISAASLRPGIAERGRRVNWQKVDEILARVPANSPVSGDEI